MSCRYLENVFSRKDNSKKILRCLEDVLCRLGSRQQNKNFRYALEAALCHAPKLWSLDVSILSHHRTLIYSNKKLIVGNNCLKNVLNAYGNSVALTSKTKVMFLQN